MFDTTTLLSMCELERNLVDTLGYTELCQKEISSNNCCRPWSLPNYVALISNKTSCFDINVSFCTLTHQKIFLNFKKTLRKIILKDVNKEIF